MSTSHVPTHRPFGAKSINSRECMLMNLLSVISFRTINITASIKKVGG